MEKIKEFLKHHYLNLILTLVITLILLIKDTIIEKYLTPKVRDDLIAEGYINPYIKEGQFISVHEKSFAENNSLPVIEAKKLITGKFVDIERYQSLEEKLRQLTTQNDAAIEHNKILTEFISFVATKQITIPLFVSSRPNDKGHIIVNINSIAINNLLETRKKYTVYGNNGNSLKLEARLEVATDSSYPPNAVLGRVHEDDYHRLFSGGLAGSRIARIAID